MGPQVGIAQQGQRTGATPLAAARGLPTLTPQQRDQVLQQQARGNAQLAQHQQPGAQMQHQTAQMQEIRQQLAAQQQHGGSPLLQQQSSGSPSSSQTQGSPHLSSNGIVGPSRQHASSPQMQLNNGMTQQQQLAALAARSAGMGGAPLGLAMHNGSGQMTAESIKHATSLQQMIWVREAFSLCLIHANIVIRAAKPAAATACTAARVTNWCRSSGGVNIKSIGAPVLVVAFSFIVYDLAFHSVSSALLSLYLSYSLLFVLPLRESVLHCLRSRRHVTGDCQVKSGKQAAHSR